MGWIAHHLFGNLLDLLGGCHHDARFYRRALTVSSHRRTPSTCPVSTVQTVRECSRATPRCSRPTTADRRGSRSQVVARGRTTGKTNCGFAVAGSCTASYSRTIRSRSWICRRLRLTIAGLAGAGAGEVCDRPRPGGVSGGYLPPPAIPKSNIFMAFTILAPINWTKTYSPGLRAAGVTLKIPSEIFSVVKTLTSFLFNPVR